MKKIKIYNGETIIVDDEDYEAAKQYNWTIKNNGKYHYVYTYEKKGLLHKKGVSYKKIILGMGLKMTLHKNMNPLDLRKENILVFNSRSEYVSAMIKMCRKKRTEFNFLVSKAAQGKGGKSTKKTTYIGVRYEPKNAHKWISIIKYNRTNHYLGSYTKEEYAALAYDKGALEFFGPDAIVNFPGMTIKEITKKLNQIKAEDAVIFYDHLSKRHQGKIFNVPKTSSYVGVSLRKNMEKCWRATIFYHNKQIFLGNYYTEEDAAYAYDKKAIELFGENARLNFPNRE